MKYEAIKIVSIFVPRPLFQWLSILVWWMIKKWLKKLQIHLLFVGWYMKTNANVMKLHVYKIKDISIFQQYFGTTDAFIYKAYYIDF